MDMNKRKYYKTQIDDKGEYCVFSTLEEAIEERKIVEDNDPEDNLCIRITYMTEDEFLSLPDFEGY